MTREVASQFFYDRVPKCTASCICTRYLPEEVIPYQAEVSPSDETLLEPWRDSNCEVAITWWIGRVHNDPYYESVIARVGTLVPGADIQSLSQALILEFCDEHESIGNKEVSNCFSYRLRMKALKECGYGLKTKINSGNHIDEILLNRIDPDSQPVDLDVQEKIKATRDCVSQLSEKERELIHARYYEKLSMKEYAATVSKSRDMIDQRSHRIRKKLKTCIERKLGLL